MSAFSTARPAASILSASVSRASIQPIALSLCHTVGARACYLALSGQDGQSPRLIATSHPTEQIPSWRSLDGLTHTRRALNRRELQRIYASDWQIMAVPLLRESRALGAALLLYSTDAAINESYLLAASDLASCALDSVRQIAMLHFEAEEIEERTRLREIQISRNLIRGIIDSVPMELALIDPAGVVLAANRALAERFGLEPAILVGMNYGAVLGTWDDSPAAQTFRTGLPQRMQRSLRGADGQVLLEMASIPLMDHEGRPHQVVEVWEDITERVALQTQLIRVERLAAIGQLAASIAHEVGNPLQAIQGFLSLFLEQCEPETPNRRFLELAEEEIDRIVQVLSRLRDLYRPRADVVTFVDINDLTQSVLLLTGKQLERGRIHLITELDPLLPQIQGVADQLKQVVLNLVLNAAEAMPDGGVLHVQTYTRSDPDQDKNVVITITDTGTGIAPDQIPFIFDGLHTTKERGMGLGLYTSKAIVERHMGRIGAQSTMGEGTTFIITLPIGEEEQTV